MSEIALRSAPRGRRAAAVLDWLRQMRAALSVPPPLAGHLPGEHLRDVDLRREEIRRAVDRGTARLGLLDLGWQEPRPSGRR